LAWPVGALILGLVVLLGFVRPSMKMISAPPPPPEEAREGGQRQLETVIGDVTERPGLLPGTEAVALDAPPSEHQLRLEDARRLSKDNPVAVANIIKTWVNGEAPA
jgi:flagellar M-ring protein FliF